MKYLHLLPFAFNGGTEKDCFFIIKELPNDQHHVIVFNKQGPMTMAWKNLGASVIHLDLIEKPLVLFKILKKISEGNYNGVFYWSTINLPLIANALSGLPGRMAVHVGNPVQPSIKTKFKNYLLSIFLKDHIPLQLYPCSLYVAESLQNDPFLRKFKYKVSYNPVKILPDNPHRPKKFNHTDTIHLGMVARLDPVKDHPTVLKAFKLVLDHFPNSLLHLYGEGPLKNKLMKLANELRIDQSVKFHGDTNLVYQKLQRLDIFVYSTTQKEGLGNVVLEALANGLPIVATDLPMMREIDGGVNTIAFVPLADCKAMALKTVDLLIDYEKRNEMSVTGHQRALAAFSPNRYAKDRTNFLIGDRN